MIFCHAFEEENENLTRTVVSLGQIGHVKRALQVQMQRM